MFPGYDLGETMQRIADGLFEEFIEYSYGIHFVSYHMTGKFTTHVRMMIPSSKAWRTLRPSYCRTWSWWTQFSSIPG